MGSIEGYESSRRSRRDAGGDAGGGVVGKGGRVVQEPLYHFYELKYHYYW